MVIRDEQIIGMQPRDSAEKELLKENLYLNQVQNLLRNHRGFLRSACNPEAAIDSSGDAPVDIQKHYVPEREIIGRVIQNERSAFLCGIALSGVVFASVRFGPRYLAVKINPDKERLLREADEIARKANTRWIQKAASFLFEASFGAWAGWRGYNIMSSTNASSYEEIARLPLCAGRSLVSETMCPEWINLVHKEIPPSFWQNLEDCDNEGGCKLKDPQRWRAVRDFANNCIKRNVYEESYRKRNGLGSGMPVDIPKGGVPDDVLLSLDSLLDEKNAD